MKIDGSVVVVTGASSGIGAATARAAARDGARVVLAARRADRLRAVAGETGAIAVSCDVTDADDREHLVQTALDEFGRIDALVNNAGQGLQSSVEHIALDDLRGLLELNLIAPLGLMQAVLPVMRQQGSGSIVNVSSGTTLADVPGTGGYVATKIALERLSAIARNELLDTGVAVSTIVPFATRTEFLESIRAGRAEAEAMTAGAEFDTPELVANTIVELIRSGAPQVDLVPAAYGGTR